MNFTIDTPKTWDEICSEPWAKEVEFRKGNQMQQEINTIVQLYREKENKLKEIGRATDHLHAMIIAEYAPKYKVDYGTSIYVVVPNYGTVIMTYGGCADGVNNWNIDRVYDRQRG